MEHISKAQVKFIRSLQQKKYRDETGLFVAEGSKCVEELRRGFEMVLMVVENQKSNVGSPEAGDKTVAATATEIGQMSSLRTPQGVIGVFRKRPCAANVQTANYILVLDGIQDPGNLGTIIRTCDWFGVHTIVCSRETADCYNPKVVQATMGALARVSVEYTSLPEWLDALRTTDPAIGIYGTLLDGRNMYEVLGGSEAPTAQRTVIIMGNEGNGISPEVRTRITHPIRIPSYTTNKETSEVVESLNVSIATAIVLAEFNRRTSAL